MYRVTGFELWKDDVNVAVFQNCSRAEDFAKYIKGDTPERQMALAILEGDKSAALQAADYIHEKHVAQCVYYLMRDSQYRLTYVKVPSDVDHKEFLELATIAKFTYLARCTGLQCDAFETNIIDLARSEAVMNYSLELSRAMAPHCKGGILAHEYIKLRAALSA